LSAVAISQKNFELKFLQLPYIMSIWLWYSADAFTSSEAGIRASSVPCQAAAGQEARMKMKLSVINLRLAAA
jgi:hypothetical protein